MSKSRIYYASSFIALCVAGFAGQALAADSAQLSEVTVTAEKREASVQKTPLAVTALGAGQIQKQHVTDLNGLNGVVPGVQIFSIVNATQVSIRGLGATFLDPRAEGAVANSLDGLYFAKPTSNGGSLFDIARVEILKGPQGTLYGRNSAAGAVNVITNRPVHYYEGALEVGGGNYNLVQTSGMLNIPVNDELALRGAFYTQKSDGYIANYYGDSDVVGLRGSALWTPTDKLTVFAEANYNHVGGHGLTSTYFPTNGVQPWTLGSPTPGVLIAKNADQDMMTANGQVQIDYNFGPVTLKSITGYVRQETTRSNVNGTSITTFLVNNLTDWTQEFRLSSNTKADHAGGLQWVAGLYYLDETASYLFKTIGLTNFPEVPQKSAAAFGQATYGVTDRLRLTAGLRYTKDDKGVTQATGSSDSISFDNTSYKVGAEYDLTSRNMIYADVTTGYISGGLNPGVRGVPNTPAQVPPSFQPEKITAYEIGSKNRFMNNRLQINADAYYYDFTNYQNFVVAYPNVGAFTGAIANVGNVTTYGVEFDGVYLLTPDDEITAALALAHGEYDKVSYPSVVLAPPFPPIVVSTGSKPLISLPETQLSLGYTHTFRLSSDSELKARIHTNYSSSYWIIPGSSDPLDQQKAYWQSDASATYSLHNGGWEVEGWIRNIEDRAVRVYGQGPASHNYQTLPPRTYGITLRVKFGGPSKG